MAASEQTISIVALLRAGGRAWARYIVQARAGRGVRSVDPRAVLDAELGLLAYGQVQDAAAQVAAWEAKGYALLSLYDDEYPQNLAVVDARPPLLFLSGALSQSDAGAVAVIGTRTPTQAGVELAEHVTEKLVAAKTTIVSGLAAGIDGVAHRRALALGGRTLAVIGTGLDHAYPREHADLQAQVAAAGAVISQFWPEAEPSRQSFPARNAVMSGITLASVIVEASPTSGTRIQARHALTQGRTVVLMAPVMDNDWARALAQQPGVQVAQSADDVVGIIRR